MRRFHFAALAAVVGIGFTSVASAADMPTKAPVAVSPPVLNWNGFYAGIAAGGGVLQTAWSNAPFGTYSGTNSGDGAIVGGTVGWNWQTNPFLFGLEGDLSWANLKVFPITNCVTNCSTELNWLGTLRGRVGYTFYNSAFLIYATGGAAFAGLENIVVTTPFSDVKQTKTGYAVGGGIEGMIARQWSAKIEYLHIEFGSYLVCHAGPCTFDNFANFVRGDIVRGGVNYHF